MKNTKNRRHSMKTVSMILAAVVSCSMVSMPEAFAAGRETAQSALPAWVPSDYGAAMEFMNTHGATYTRDNYVCFCIPVIAEEDVCDGDASAVVKEARCSYTTLLDTVLPYQCEYDFANGAPKREDYPDTDEWFAVSRKYEEWCAHHGEGYRVTVWSLDDDGTFSIVPKHANYIDYDTVYEFERKKIGGNLLDAVQTGWYSWVPDCEKEYDAFVARYGHISHHGNYLFCAGGISASTGQRMEITTEGTGKVGSFVKVDCSAAEWIPVDGGSSKIIQYAVAEQAGTLTVTLDPNHPQMPASNRMPVETADYLIKENLQIVDADADPHCIEDWVPMNYDSALAFSNRYGSTHIQDGCICFCLPCSDNDEYRLWDAYRTAVSNAPSAIAQYDTIKDEVYECRYSASAPQRYHVVVLAPKTTGAMAFIWDRVEPWIDSAASPAPVTDIHTYTFTVNPGMEIEETDLYGWMPDCEDEFREYVREHGEISVHDKYLVCAVDVNYSTGAEYSIDTNGTGKIGDFRTIGCSRQETEGVCGSSSQFMCYAEAEKAGTLTVTMEINIPWAPEEYKDPPISKEVGIDDNLTFYELVPPVLYDIPDWVPREYSEANDFFNTYGKSLVKDGYICVCFPYTGSAEWDHVLMDNRQSGKLDANTFNGASFEVLADSDYQYPNTMQYYHVAVFKPVSSGLMDIGFYRCPADQAYDPAANQELYNLTFDVNGKTIKETDLFGWLPDCAAEWHAWVEKNGTTAAYENYLVCCDGVTGAAELTVKTAGDASLKKVLTLYPDEQWLPDQTPPAPGTASNVLYLYQAEQPGMLSVKTALTWQTASGVPVEEHVVRQVYEVDENCVLHLYEGSIGDLNGDDDSNIADMVAMQQYLRGSRQLSQAEIMLADLNGDFRVNAIDLTLFKRNLLAQRTK